MLTRARDVVALVYMKQRTRYMKQRTRPAPTRRRPRLLYGSCAVSLLVALLVIARSPAARAGEQEWVVSPTLSYAVLSVEGSARHGGAVGLDVDYGLSDSWSLRGAGRYAALAMTGPSRALLSAGSLGFGVLYTFDVLRVVPYASLQVGASAIGGGSVDLRWNAEIAAGVGADYLVSRDFSVGLEIRYALQVPDVTRLPYMFVVSVRLSWRRP